MKRVLRETVDRGCVHFTRRRGLGGAGDFFFLFLFFQDLDVDS